MSPHHAYWLVLFFRFEWALLFLATISSHQSLQSLKIMFRSAVLRSM
jgi:hypothetical protein